MGIGVGGVRWEGVEGENTERNAGIKVHLKGGVETQCSGNVLESMREILGRTPSNGGYEV